MAEINGTTGADTLTGTPADDVINGFSGQDQLNGKAGADIIDGGGGNDTLNGGFGNDLLDGGDGNDNLFDEGGSDRLRGGEGDDRLYVYRYENTGVAETVSIDGGTGNDDVLYTNANAGSAIIDLGDGDDRIELGRAQEGGLRVTLGAGRDRIDIAPYAELDGRAIVTDFAFGDAGDVVLLDRYLNYLLVNWDKSSNPFATDGYLKLVAEGSDTRLIVDRDGTGLDYAPTTLLVFADTAPSRFTAGNFDGFGPDGAAVASRMLVGTSGNDALAGAASDDRIDGLDGFDQIDGKAGDDVIDAGGGSDFIYGGYGDDRIDGGDGADHIFDDAGSDTLRGGAGDDRFSIHHRDVAAGGATETIVVEAGAGNDSVGFGSRHLGSTRLDLGEGDDTVGFGDVVNNAVRVTLGLGRDVITLSQYDTIAPGAVVVTDFAAGATGDVVSLESFIANRLIGWDQNANPFGASGYLRLDRSGSSTLLQLDRDGASGAAHDSTTLLTFENSQPDAFDAANFEGLRPDGGAIVGRTLSGTNNSDTLTGTLGADAITGFGGDDRIDGKGGADVINGGAGRDSIYGGFGDDQVDGGDGDDYIYDEGGSDTLRGGAGDDDITISRFRSVRETINIEGGAGADEVAIHSGPTQSLIVELGIGDDVLRLESLSGGDLRATLGAGRDTVQLPSFGQLVGPITLTDFATGATGDVLRIDDYLNGQLIGWNSGANPFGPAGYLRLAQFGATTLLQLDRDGASGSAHGYATLLTLQNSVAAQFTATNFGGMTPSFVDADAATTAFVTAPALIAEDGGQSFSLAVTLRNVSQVNGTVTMSFAAARSTALNGPDVGVPDYTGSFAVSQSPAGTYAITLPSISVLADQVAEGTETVAVTIRVSGQLFDTGTDTKTVLVKLIDAGQTGGAGADALTGTRFADDLTGAAGDDRILAGLGDDRIDGGAGLDTAVFTGLYQRSSLGLDGGATIVDGPDGRDTLTGVERFQFADGIFVVDPGSAGASIQRLYDAVLDRAPDAAGLDYYLDFLEDRSGTLLGVANDLIGSREFQAATGQLDNGSFVEFLYRQTLDRAPDDGGKAYYSDRLDKGMSRVALMLEFAEAAEHRALTADLVAAGYFNTDDRYQAVAALYDSFVGRLPDEGGLVFYGERVKSGAMTLGQVAADFAGSAEFRSATQGKTNAELVDHAYRNTLDRAPDADGAAYYTDRLNKGLSLADFIAEVGFSQEHYNLMSGYIVGGIDVM